MWKERETYPRDVWGGAVYLDGIGNGFEIYDDGDAPEEACIELLTHDWKIAQVKIIYVNNSSLEYNDNYVIPPVKIDDAAKICSDSDKHDLEMHYYFGIDPSRYSQAIADTAARL